MKTLSVHMSVLRKTAWHRFQIPPDFKHFRNRAGVCAAVRLPEIQTERGVDAARGFPAPISEIHVFEAANLFFRLRRQRGVGACLGARYTAKRHALKRLYQALSPIPSGNGLSGTAQTREFSPAEGRSW